MKKLLLAALILSSCAVTKNDHKTWNTTHMEKIHGSRHADSTGTYRSYADFKTNKK